MRYGYEEFDHLLFIFKRDFHIFGHQIITDPEHYYLQKYHGRWTKNVWVNIPSIPRAPRCRRSGRGRSGTCPPSSRPSRPRYRGSGRCTPPTRAHSARHNCSESSHNGTCSVRKMSRDILRHGPCAIGVSGAMCRIQIRIRSDPKLSVGSVSAIITWDPDP